MSTAIDVATEKDLKWLNNGFDDEAMSRLEASYIERATNSSPTPPHWRFPDMEAADRQDREAAQSS